MPPRLAPQSRISSMSSNYDYRKDMFIIKLALSIKQGLKLVEVVSIHSHRVEPALIPYVTTLSL
jgi:hypothetical protein